MVKALVNKIIPFSSVDGPGNRLALFLQGCNFNCLYCHNPETINTCINCLTCVKACPYSALDIVENKVSWNKGKCESCDMCIQACPFDSTPKTQYMEVEEILKEIERVRPFITGITVSGGECMLQADFLLELFKEVKSMGLTAFIDTNGSIPFKDKEKLTDLMDMAMIDMKSFDPDEHKRLTGKDNSVVLENIEYLAKKDKLYEVRTVIVPNYLDNSYNVNSISKLISSLNPNIRYKLIKYRPLGVRPDKISTTTPSDEVMEELAGIAHSNGCKNIVIT